MQNATLSTYFDLFIKSIDKGDYNSAEYYLNKARPIVKRQPENKSLQLHYCMYESSLMNNMGHFAKSIERCEMAYQYIPKSGMTDVMANLENSMATAYMNLGRYEDALTHNENSTKYFQRLNNKELTAANFITKGNILWRQGNWAEAISLFSEALGIARKHNYTKVEAESYMNLGVVFQGNLFFHLAIEHFKDSERAFRKIKNEVGIWHAMYERANSLISLRQIDLAIRLIEDMGYMKVSSLPFANTVWNLWYVIHNQKEEFDTSLSYAQKMLNFSESINDIRNIGNSKEKIGASYYNLRDMDKAISYGEEALSIAEEIGDQLLIGRCRDLIYNAKTYSEDDTRRDK